MLPRPFPAALILPVLAACSGGGGDALEPPASGGRWYVDASAPAGGNGRSWARAFDDLQRALAAADAGDEVWVAAGTYRPSVHGDRDAAFVLQSDVRLFGGFAGGETKRSQQDPLAHPTILSGDLAGDDGPDFAGTLENSFHVVAGVGVDGAVLDGFVIRGGRADGPGQGPSPDSRDQGAGINLFGGSITVRDCRIEANWTENHGAVNDHSDGSLFLACEFAGNHTERLGAGLYLHHQTATQAIGCFFTDNVSLGDGAGAYTRSMHGARFEQCRFEGNRAQNGAGIYAAPESATHLEWCTFTGNAAEIGGGGSYNDEAFTVLESCSFDGNEAGTEVEGGGGGGGGSGGGGVWANGGEPVVRDCHFEANRASFGAGFYAIHECLGAVEGCEFLGNRAEEAGGVYTLNSAIRVSDCTFDGNVAEGGVFSVGGGLSNYFSDSIVQRCTFRGNAAWLGGGGMYSEGEDPLVRLCRFEGNRTLGPQGYGGGMMNGYFTRARVEDCAFTGNVGRQGGGVYDIAFSEAVYANCTIAGNVAEQGGGAFAGYLATPAFANCAVALCTPDAIAGEPVACTYACVEGGYAGAGNLDAVPAFARPPSPGDDATWGTGDDDHGDLALLPGSPGIDAGWNDAHENEAEVDLVGMPRFVDDPATLDTGSGLGPIVDIGCREHAP